MDGGSFSRVREPHGPEGQRMSTYLAQTIEVVFPGSLLATGFWLYVWRVRTREHGDLLYVGRTGDSSSAKAAPPYRRMGQHLGFVKASNALRTHLAGCGVVPESCTSFQFIAHGPIFAQQSKMSAHKPFRNRIAALEKKLADSLRASGYEVLNTVNCRMELDAELWRIVREAFAPYFPELAMAKNQE